MGLLTAMGAIGGLVVGLVVGILSQLHRRNEADVARRLAEARLGASEAGLATARRETEALREEAGRLRVAVAETEGRLTQERRAAQERESALEMARRELAGEFARLSREALASNNEQFLHLADLRLQAAREQAQGELAQRQEAIGAIVHPLGEQLQRYGEKVEQLENRRDRAHQELLEKVALLDRAHRELERETRNLASALRSPSARGRWGELQLRKVVELAGMVAHCDFDVQVTGGSEGDRQRPDMVVHLPGGKQVVVDAKVPLEAFQSAVSCDSEEERRRLMASHARQVRAHLEALSKKEYWRRFEPSPEFVVAFIPGDPLLAAAFEHDGGLIEFAVANHVLPATPTTLISLLWAVAYGWQQDVLADNARQVQRLGSELYQRLTTLGDHLGRVGRGLTSTVRAYNDAVGSLESRVMVTARRFPELGVPAGGDKAPPELEPVELVPRALQAPELVELGADASVVRLRGEPREPEAPASGGS